MYTPVAMRKYHFESNLYSKYIRYIAIILTKKVQQLFLKNVTKEIKNYLNKQRNREGRHSGRRTMDGGMGMWEEKGNRPWEQADWSILTTHSQCWNRVGLSHLLTTKRVTIHLSCLSLSGRCFSPNDNWSHFNPPVSWIKIKTANHQMPQLFESSQSRMEPPLS